MRGEDNPSGRGQVEVEVSLGIMGQRGEGGSGYQAASHEGSVGGPGGFAKNHSHIRYRAG